MFADPIETSVESEESHGYNALLWQSDIWSYFVKTCAVPPNILYDPIILFCPDICGTVSFSTLRSAKNIGQRSRFALYNIFRRFQSRSRKYLSHPNDVLILPVDSASQANQKGCVEVVLK